MCVGQAMMVLDVMHPDKNRRVVTMSECFCMILFCLVRDAVRPSNADQRVANGPRRDRSNSTREQ